ncbi:Zinc finger C2H2 [Penicillium coprophilum]|uniref:Zinc finger C2H2 n=1 Tax=Penicillium coprophilum TaxID=36646 RepID=UPI00239EF162|nr:Zinc finger C2H2 [Penicillium coprophilum]KAJ5177517.1 Zinc finger C2H2 [Penicillium coprophilum]
MAGNEGHDLFDPKSSNLPFDAANPLLDLQLGSLDPTLHHSLLSQWPSHSRDLYYPRYTHPRLTGDQDAWNPLLATGVPATSSISHMNMPAQVPDQDCCFSQHYSEPSESGSQYIDSHHSADSGYGGTSCTTQSVVASSYGMESSSPQMDMTDNMSAESKPSFDRLKYGSVSEESYTSEFMGSPSQLVDASMRCEHPSCKWVGKCPSDKRKHEARHKKLFKCDVPNCPRKDGFGTINDLARHKKCVHNKEPERGPKMMYMCFGAHCPRPNKKWPRLDNFKQHLNRMHQEEDGEALLKKSMDWYEKVILRQPEQSRDSRNPRDSSVFESHDDEMSVQSTPDIELESGSTSQQKTDIFTFGDATPRPPQYGTPSLADSVPSQFPAFTSLGLSTSQGPSAERGMTRPDGSVTDAADNLINAMTKMMNNRGRRSSQNTDEGIDLGADAAQLSQPQRQMLQKVLSVALERLSDDNQSIAQDHDNEKRDWFQCDACPKRTRLRCEMKKHQKRHERPYGCTFPHCAKSFGSKADWKRHESSQHLSVPSWFCTEHDVQTGASCERLFYRPETYTHHLHQHGVHEYQVAASTGNNRLDLAGQSHFWCGFCNCRVPLRNHGPEASDERFNHIDIEHFKKGERGQDWRFPSSSLDGDEMNQTKDVAVQTFDRSRKTAATSERKRKYAAV